MEDFFLKENKPEASNCVVLFLQLIFDDLFYKLPMTSHSALWRKLDDTGALRAAVA